LEIPVSDVEVKRKESLSRQEAAEWMAGLAEAMTRGGKVEVHLGTSTLKMHVPDQVRCEVEIEVDGDEVELEIELKWSTEDSTDDKSEPAPAKSARTTAKAATRTGGKRTRRVRS
jgi:amphi-Trp domain-containing protein